MMNQKPTVRDVDVRGIGEPFPGCRNPACGTTGDSCSCLYLQTANHILRLHIRAIGINRQLDTRRQSELLTITSDRVQLGSQPNSTQIDRLRESAFHEFVLAEVRHSLCQDQRSEAVAAL